MCQVSLQAVAYCCSRAASEYVGPRPETSGAEWEEKNINSADDEDDDNRNGDADC